MHVLFLFGEIPGDREGAIHLVGVEKGPFGCDRLSAMTRTVLALTLLPAALIAADVATEKTFGGAQIQEMFRVRLDRGDLLLESLEAIIRKYQIQDGAVVAAAGSLQECTFHAVTSLAEKPEEKFTTRKGAMEILNVNGIIAGGEPHFHLTLSEPTGPAFGGHLEKGCKVLYRAELLIAKFNGVKVARLPNKAGVPLMQRTK